MSSMVALAWWDNWHSFAAVCSSTPRPPPAPQVMPTPQPVLLAWDARAASRQGSGRKHRVIKVEFHLGGQRNAEEVLVSECEGANHGVLESSLESLKDKGMQQRKGRGKDAPSLLHMPGHTAHSCRLRHHSTATHEAASTIQPLNTPQYTHRPL